MYETGQSKKAAEAKAVTDKVWCGGVADVVVW
jgi:hypothetical protein